MPHMFIQSSTIVSDGYRNLQEGQQVEITLENGNKD
jgi:cold shock CspA family protein